jgi:hypothetical protein
MRLGAVAMFSIEPLFRQQTDGLRVTPDALLFPGIWMV